MVSNTEHITQPVVSEEMKILRRKNDRKRERKRKRKKEREKKEEREVASGCACLVSMYTQEEKGD